ncbi:amidase 1 [Hordeum vulgare]|nr:amidase 1 [Hordeum vulgare]
MDKMAYSINGENAHYGTPNNPCAPGRVPGGCAVAVAASLADFALGTNTGGSVRVPAAYCGIFGLRPSHGVVSAENIVPMAQMFDTVGWFARDLATLPRVSDVLLPPVSTDTADAELRQPSRVIIPADCFRILGSSDDDHTYEILNACAAKVFVLSSYHELPTHHCRLEQSRICRVV